MGEIHPAGLHLTSHLTECAGGGFRDHPVRNLVAPAQAQNFDCPSMPNMGR